VRVAQRRRERAQRRVPQLARRPAARRRRRRQPHPRVAVPRQRGGGGGGGGGGGVADGRVGVGGGGAEDGVEGGGGAVQARRPQPADGREPHLRRRRRRPCVQLRRRARHLSLLGALLRHRYDAPGRCGPPPPRRERSVWGGGGAGRGFGRMAAASGATHGRLPRPRASPRGSCRAGRGGSGPAGCAGDGTGPREAASCRGPAPPSRAPRPLSRCGPNPLRPERPATPLRCRRARCFPLPRYVWRSANGRRWRAVGVQTATRRGFCAAAGTAAL
jgi:hypothetical protein